MPGNYLGDLDFPINLVYQNKIIQLFDAMPEDYINNYKDHPLFQERVKFNVMYAVTGYKVVEQFEGTIYDGLMYVKDHYWSEEYLEKGGF